MSQASITTGSWESSVQTHRETTKKKHIEGDTMLRIPLRIPKHHGIKRSLINRLVLQPSKMITGGALNGEDVVNVYSKRRLHILWKSPFSIGKANTNRSFSIAMSNYQEVVTGRYLTIAQFLFVLRRTSLAINHSWLGARLCTTLLNRRGLV